MKIKKFKKSVSILTPIIGMSLAGAIAYAGSTVTSQGTEVMSDHQISTRTVWSCVSSRVSQGDDYTIPNLENGVLVLKGFRFPGKWGDGGVRLSCDGADEVLVKQETSVTSYFADSSNYDDDYRDDGDLGPAERSPVWRGTQADAPGAYNYGRSSRGSSDYNGGGYSPGGC